MNSIYLSKSYIMWITLIKNEFPNYYIYYSYTLVVHKHIMNFWKNINNFNKSITSKVATFK